MSSFFDVLQGAQRILSANHRASLKALRREFDLDDEVLDELVEELVSVRQVAAREGDTLVWIGEPAGDRGESVTPLAEIEEGERRHLTVMFCDMVDSTSLSEQLDPEDLSELIATYHSICSEAIKRYDGHIAQYLGDGVLVYFGYPRAHADAAERAIRAALMIQQRIASSSAGPPLGARIGIHTGPVVIAEMGQGEHRETLAVGDTPNLAARLQGVAEPGAIVVSEATLRRGSGLFVTSDLGTPALAGVLDPVRAYRVDAAQGVTSLFDSAVEEGPLIARDLELGILLDRLDQVVEGRGHVVLVSGEAGIGKSRLLRAFCDRIRTTPHTRLDARCSPHTRGTAFEPIVSLLERGLGFDTVEAPEERLERLETAMETVSDGNAAKIVPYLSALLSLPESERYPLPALSPELQRERTLAATVELVALLQQPQPVVLILEDLHWADPSTLEYLGRLIEQAPRLRLLVLATARPEFSPPWPVARGHVTVLSVTRLSHANTRSLALATAGARSIPASILDEIVKRADGVPLFVEEITRSAVDSRLLQEVDGRLELTGHPTDLSVPETLQDSLMERLDRLSAAKRTAQIAATLGQEFSYALIEAVAELDPAALRTGLNQLVEAEIVYQRGAPPEADYSFRHALFQETAYESLLKRTRRELHGRVVSVLEERFAERVESHPEAMIQHCREASLLDKAVDYSELAGKQAIERLANAEAVAHLEGAIELLGTLPETTARDAREIALRVSLSGPLGVLRGYHHASTLGLVERLEALSRRRRGVEQVPALIALAAHYSSVGDSRRQGIVAKRILPIARELGVAVLEAAAHSAAAAAALVMDPLAVAFEHYHAALALCEQSEMPRPTALFDLDTYCLTLTIGGIMHADAGHVAKARELLRRAIERAEQLDHPFSRAQCLAMAVTAEGQLRDFAAARAWALRALPVARECGFRTTEAMAVVMSAWSSDSESAVDDMKRSVQEAEEGGVGNMSAVRLELAVVLTEAGRYDEARQELAAVAEREEPFGERNYRTIRLTSEAEIAFRTGDVESAENLASEAQVDAQERGLVIHDLHAQLVLARVALARGEQTRARELLETIRAQLADEPAIPLSTEAEALLATLA